MIVLPSPAIGHFQGAVKDDPYREGEMRKGPLREGETRNGPHRGVVKRDGPLLGAVIEGEGAKTGDHLQGGAVKDDHRQRGRPLRIC